MICLKYLFELLNLAPSLQAYEAKLGDLLLEARLQSQARSEALRQV